MSRTTRSLLEGAKDVSPIILGVIPFGLVAGAAVVEAGHGVLEAFGMSFLVTAGASQLAATTLSMEGAPLLVVIGTALVVNARFLIYSSSIAPVLAPKAGRWRAVIGHPIIDQTYAIAMTEGRQKDVAIVPYFVGSWLILATVWQITNVLGALAGALVPEAWSLDFAVPLVFLAMLFSALERRLDFEAAAASAVAAAVLIPVLPLQTGLPVAILIGMMWGALRDRNDAEGASPAGEPQETP